MQHNYRILAQVVLLATFITMACFSVVCAQEDNAIIGGSRVGPVTLGQQLSRYETYLGPGRAISPKFTEFKKRGMAILHEKGTITGILVYSNQYKTPEGIQVGDSLSKLTKAYGSYLKSDGGSLNYTDLGLAVNPKDNKIRDIMVVYAAPDPLLGDKMIVPGTRAGKIRIGDDISTVTRAWNNPDEEKELEGNKKIKAFIYEKKAVKVLASNGMIVGVRVNSYKYRTPQGIGINSTLEQVLKTYGKGYKKVEDSYMYSKAGIGFYIHKNKVIEILVTYPKE